VNGIARPARFHGRYSLPPRIPPDAGRHVPAFTSRNAFVPVLLLFRTPRRFAGAQGFSDTQLINASAHTQAFR